MALHFAREEFAQRQRRTLELMAERGLDGLLMFRQESMFYLTGYDTFGFVFFQCLYLGADGTLILLTRVPDLRQAQHTSTIADIRIWVDGEDAKPAVELRHILEQQRCRGKKLGVEWEAYGLTARNGRRLADALDGVATLEDASDLVSRQRLIKSPAEIAYVRDAARLADRAWDEAIGLARPGADEAEILAAMQGAVFRGGGDYPANEFIIGSGRDALLCRFFSGRRTLSAEDQLTLEFAGTYRHYHSCLMRTIRVGPKLPRQEDMHKACKEALLACEAALKPGEPVANVFEAHVKVLDRAGYRAHRLNACGYSLGALFAPNWMDWPMLYRGNPVIAAPGMVFFIHMIIMDSDSGIAMTLGRTSLVGEQGAEPLSQAAIDYVCV
ncbi:MAG: aminopeptidase P family protein [Proteobacteria bacterium]|nr:aminopeptidase P family protein [Pseudomonadota bacterium]MBI3497636.1 aminopeptidase P family protein [Pseudomonadota bacterium]